MEKEPVKTPFIVIDGMDGSGKGTQMTLLIERATREGRTFINTREPGGTPLAEKIRELFKSSLGMGASSRTQFLLMWAARSDLLENVVIPHLDNGTPVFLDRGDDSTLAYQAYAKQAPELEGEFWRMREFILGKYAPSLYLIVDLSAEEAKRRVDADKQREASDFDLEPLGFYQRVRQGFHAFRDKLPHKVMMIDGDRPPEVIHEEVYKIVSELCGWK
ncbi:MAG: dTMP kinase [Minisyncoccota bacterium]